MSADPRPMTLPEQADFIETQLRDWKCPAPGDRMACAPIWLRDQDVQDLRTIAKTLRILGVHGADDYVRAKVAREKKDRAK